jgi:hypothetical protein
LVLGSTKQKLEKCSSFLEKDDQAQQRNLGKALYLQIFSSSRAQANHANTTLVQKNHSAITHDLGIPTTPYNRIAEINPECLGVHCV